MSVLLLRLSGPMQSWGVQSRFSVRDTGMEPSKSGVVGLLCAALGRCRDEPVDDLADLTMGVRVDQEGKLARDFQTAMSVLKAGGGIKTTEPSSRYYLSDARFLVGLQGEDTALLRQIHGALRNPHWPLYLGRRAFVPGEPVWLEDGLQPDQSLPEALQIY
ncbi:MAG: type I-E CRISPR-associated protein Cas5/CasD, partial [Chloroflexi bacterium]|nr:type I-E CRISPR-associated protein Cas5/CasD [Chloroflexota bacterium]